MTDLDTMIAETRRLRQLANETYKARVEAADAHRKAHEALSVALVADGGWYATQVLKTTDDREAKISHFYLSQDGELIASCYRRIQSGAWSQRPELRVTLKKVDLENNS